MNTSNWKEEYPKLSIGEALSRTKQRIYTAINGRHSLKEIKPLLDLKDKLKRLNKLKSLDVNTSVTNRAISEMIGEPLDEKFGCTYRFIENLNNYIDEKKKALHGLPRDNKKCKTSDISPCSSPGQDSDNIAPVVLSNSDPIIIDFTAETNKAPKSIRPATASSPPKATASKKDAIPVKISTKRRREETEPTPEERAHQDVLAKVNRLIKKCVPAQDKATSECNAAELLAVTQYKKELERIAMDVK